MTDAACGCWEEALHFWLSGLWALSIELQETCQVTLPDSALSA